MRSNGTMWGWAWPTLGGRQFWGDVWFEEGWRIQHRAGCERYRLLDPHDWRRAGGSFDECRAALERHLAARPTEASNDTVVVLVHGIVRSSKSMSQLTRAAAQHGWTAAPFDYPSTRVAIPESARYLDRMVRSLRHATRLHFVTHSMGALVVREWMRQSDDDRLGRMVMLAPPNQGAEMADLLHRQWLYRAVMGPAGQQLVSGPGSFAATLPPPRCEFGVIAAVRGNGRGWNPLISGDDDLTLGLASTPLAGAADTATVRGLHTLMMRSPETIDLTIRFLETGRFHA